MKTLCFGCMRQKESSPVCEYCGYDARAENQPHQLPIGTILQNQYLVGRVLGQGGFGITYIGWDQHLSIPVAIKEYYPGGVVQRNTRWSTDVMCANGEAPELFEKHKTKFLKEARTLAQLSEIPEIVQIKSFFPENDTAYIVMEYVEGITLKDHLKKLGRPMTEEEALAIMEPVLKALQKVHDNGLIHRDISPDNIMLPKSGGVKLIDFGTVRYMDDSGKSKSTEAVLKPGFAPMEQYNTRGNLGTWTDVYAICATYHYLLTGKVPADVHDRMDEGESLTILRARSGISKKLIATLEKGMKLRATERIQTVKELHQLLYPARKNSPAKTQPGEKKVSPQKKEGTGKKGTVAIACALAAVAIGAAMMLLIPRQQASLSTPETTVAPAQTTSEATVPTVPETTEPLSPEEIAYAEAEALLANGETAKAAITFGKLGDYKDARERSFALWRRVIPQQTFSAGYRNTAAIKNDGTVMVAGTNESGQLGAKEWTNITAISVDVNRAVGLREDGTIAVVGRGAAVVSNWRDIVAIETSGNSTVALRADGTVLGSGCEECVLSWTDIVAIGESHYNTIGLKADGTVIAACEEGHDYGQCNVSNWSDIVGISAGYHFVVGLKADGTVLVAGDFSTSIADWTDIISISAGNGYIAGLKSNGTVVVATRPKENIPNLNPSEWTNIVAINAGMYYLVGLKNDGTLVSVGKGTDGIFDVTDQWTNIRLPN